MSLMIFSGETTDAFKYKSQRLYEVLQAVQIVYDGAGARSVLALCPSSTSKLHHAPNGYNTLPSIDENKI